jgi:hypothetical protein
MNKILFIAGNGLSIDLFQYLGSPYNPSSPFLFDVPHPLYGDKKLLDELTRVKEMIKAGSGKNDFVIIEDFINNYREDEEHLWRHGELRQYLSLAYAHANADLLARWRSGWRWEQWLNKNYSKLAGAVSFNYDLGLETTLSKLSLEYYRPGTPEEDTPKGIPIFKPHGSCDFDISNRAISMPLEARLKSLTRLNDAGIIEVVSKNKLSEPRTEADIVLPFEKSPQRHLRWIQRGEETIKKIAKTVDTCIIVGISYRSCDRQEIDSIINELPRDIKIELVTPTENKKFEKRLREISCKAEKIAPEIFLKE